MSILGEFGDSEINTETNRDPEIIYLQILSDKNTDRLFYLQIILFIYKLVQPDPESF